MTTFGSLGLDAKFSGVLGRQSRLSRDSHIPLEPAGIHPCGYLPLTLRENAQLGKPSWIRTDRIWRVPLAIFEIWGASKTRRQDGNVRLTEYSITRLICYTALATSFLAPIAQLRNWKQQLQDFPQRWEPRKPREVIRDGVSINIRASGLKELVSIGIRIAQHGQILPHNLPAGFIWKDPAVPMSLSSSQTNTNAASTDGVPISQLSSLAESWKCPTSVSLPKSQNRALIKQQVSEGAIKNTPRKWTKSVLRFAPIQTGSQAVDYSSAFGAISVIPPISSCVPWR
jgi:hypothetical protein